MSKLDAISLRDTSLPKIKVHATVVFSILNNFTRRSPRDSRVIGTLLGEVKDGVVHVTDCFAVPFTEKVDELLVTIDQKYHKSMYAFHLRNNRRETIVGWYTTTTEQGQFLNDNSSLINNFYRTECERPVHLVVDTTLIGDNLDVRGFMSKPIYVGEDLLAQSFQEVKVDVAVSDSEATALYHMINGQDKDSRWEEPSIVSALPTTTRSVEDAILQLQKVLDSAQTYVDAVVDNNAKVAVSREIGIALADSLNSFAAQKASAHQQSALQTRLQDLVMVSYISTLTQTQALISEKLNEVLV